MIELISFAYSYQSFVAERNSIVSFAKDEIFIGPCNTPESRNDC